MNFLFSKMKSKSREDVDGYGMAYGYCCSNCNNTCSVSCSTGCYSSCSGGSSGNYSKKTKKCGTCFKEFEDDCKYCPYDGTLLKENK